MMDNELRTARKRMAGKEYAFLAVSLSSVHPVAERGLSPEGGS